MKKLMCAVFAMIAILFCSLTSCEKENVNPGTLAPAVTPLALTPCAWNRVWVDFTSTPINGHVFHYSGYTNVWVGGCGSGFAGGMGGMVFPTVPVDPRDIVAYLNDNTVNHALDTCIMLEDMLYAFYNYDLSSEPIYELYTNSYGLLSDTEVGAIENGTYEVIVSADGYWGVTIPELSFPLDDEKLLNVRLAKK